MNTLVVCSGGLDSVSLAHMLAAGRALGAIVTFDYNQRHRREIDYARLAAERLGVPFHLVDIQTIGAVLTGSALTDAVDVPDGHYAEDTMKATIVPNRNAIMLTIAFGLAASRGMDAVAIAVHGGDHFIYPDCRPGFIDAFAAMQAKALDGFAEVRLLAPFAEDTKADIVRAGARAGTPFAQTWSCYKGGEMHCGRCGTCVERREAFEIAGVDDPTVYADPHYWRDAVAARSA